MPNIWTHILFVDEICDKSGRQDVLQTSRVPLHLGAQGPDPFFYHNFWPFRSSHTGQKLGTLLHTKQCGPFLMDLIKSGINQKHNLQAFILGYVSHHLLDRHTHPFIHYYAGFEAYKHQELEVVIDTIMLRKKRKQETWKNPVYPEIKPVSYIDSISTLLYPLIHRHYEEAGDLKVNKLIHQSYQHMYQAQRVLYDPWKWKNKWLSSYVSSFSHQPVGTETDFLNEKQSSWYHSATNTEQKESFLDLFWHALQEGLALFQIIFAYWEHPTPSLEKQIESKIADISYDTGLPLLDHAENQYSSPIL